MTHHIKGSSIRLPDSLPESSEITAVNGLILQSEENKLSNENPVSGKTVLKSEGESKTSPNNS